MDDKVPGGLQAEVAVGDILLQNDRVSAVVEALDHPHYLGPSGGNLLDLGTRGDDNDSLTQMFLATGILPGDAVYYERMEMLAVGPEVAAVQFLGRLDGHAKVRVNTRYEMRRCDPGVRIRTELINLEAEPLLWPVYDTFYWAEGKTQPFAPVAGVGFANPDLDLEELDSLTYQFPYMAAASHSIPSASYAVTGCSVQNIAGFNSDEVSAIGLEPEIVYPWDYRVYERFIAVGDGTSISASVDLISSAREKLFGDKIVNLSGRTVLGNGAPVGGNEALISVLIYQIRHDQSHPTMRIPRSQVVPDADGIFSALVPAVGSYHLEAGPSAVL